MCRPSGQRSEELIGIVGSKCLQDGAAHRCVRSQAIFRLRENGAGEIRRVVCLAVQNSGGFFVRKKRQRADIDFFRRASVLLGNVLACFLHVGSIAEAADAEIRGDMLDVVPSVLVIPRFRRCAAVELRIANRITVERDDVVVEITGFHFEILLEFLIFLFRQY